MRTRALHEGPPSPRLSVMKILKRRKTTLKQWATELNVTTLDSAKVLCNRLGLAPPTDAEWTAVFADPKLPPVVSDASEGVIIVTPEDVHSDLVVEAVFDSSIDVPVEDTEKPKRKSPSKRRPKKSQETE